MTEPARRLSWLGSATGLLAVAACYGTLGAVALLSMIGISVDIDEATLTTLITALLVVALLGMAYSWRLHRQPGPLLLGVAAALILLWVFFAEYSSVGETMGFALLIIASLWDLRAKKRCCGK